MWSRVRFPLLRSHPRWFSSSMIPRLDEDPRTLRDFVRASARTGTRPPLRDGDGDGDGEKGGEVRSRERHYLGGEMASSLVEGTWCPPRVFVETYGCQMNVSDSEIVRGIMQTAGYSIADQLDEADIVLINTCAIRENAENRVWTRLRELRAAEGRARREGGTSDAIVSRRTIGLLGCMAERLKSKLLEGERLVDIVAGPDAYRDLPRLLSAAYAGDAAINVLLSADETYADVAPVRESSTGRSAFVSIMRGCNNMCSYCIVPFTRGRERSRNIDSILDEIRLLSDQGIKEVTLLGQNVNSYVDTSSSSIYMSSVATQEQVMSRGFGSLVPSAQGHVRFTELVDRVSLIDPEMRIRFTSPHPKDFPDSLLELMANRSNVCNQIHLPAQSGNSEVLRRMRRFYTREAYLELAEHIRELIPGVSLSSDFIAGFCGETETEHADTISLIQQVKYEHAFLFAYSMREKTHAHRRLEDDVPQEVKLRRLSELIKVFHEGALARNRADVGSLQLVLVEGTSRRSSEHLVGRADSNKRVVFPKAPVPNGSHDTLSLSVPHLGEYVCVSIDDCTSATLLGKPLYRTSIGEFSALNRS